jgi:hypothetical protein
MIEIPLRGISRKRVVINEDIEKFNKARFSGFPVTKNRMQVVPCRGIRQGSPISREWIFTAHSCLLS